jgi:nucleoside-diphosphate-sugar epimerase
MPTVFLTGGTGFVGSHVAETLKAAGWTVRALARPGSDTAFLQSLGVEIIPGDFTSAEQLRAAIGPAEYIVHSAAKVGDWGPVEDYRAVNVEGLRKLLDGCIGLPLKRFVHVSSLGVYEARHHYGTDEREPLPEQHIDGYTQSKVESENLAMEYVRTKQLPLVVLRPGFIYGPRDRSVLPRLIERLQKRTVKYIAGGRYALNTTYVGNLVHTIQLALDHPAAVGEIFNITDGEFVSKRKFFEAVADGLGLPRPKRSIPLWIARPLARWREGAFRRKNKPYPPIITQAVVKFAGLNLDFSIGKARTQLNYQPPYTFAQGMAEALTWFRKQQGTE